jgi:hypothetical protein
VFVFQLYFAVGQSFSQAVLSKIVSVNFENTAVEIIINHLQTNYSVNFSYSKTLVDLSEKISIRKDRTTLNTVLETVFENKNVSFVEKAGIIVLKPIPQNIDKQIVYGQIFDTRNQPIQYAALMFQKTHKGIVSDLDGDFKILIRKSDLEDTLVISSLGFETKKIPVSNMRPGSTVKVFLVDKSIELGEVNVTRKKMFHRREGNTGFLSLGSLYIDTHGQQTALFIENENKQPGKIIAVNFRLSKNGNTAAPFRIRIYEPDTASSKPGKDLLNEMIIAKPTGKSGTFSMNVSQYNITIPEDGFFVGIEGVYTGQITNPNNEEVESVNFDTETFPETISYGQQLCYSRARGKNTWHFSPAGTWFQLEKNNYNIMISVDLKIER